MRVHVEKWTSWYGPRLIPSIKLINSMVHLLLLIHLN